MSDPSRTGMIARDFPVRIRFGWSSLAAWDVSCLVCRRRVADVSRECDVSRKVRGFSDDGTPIDLVDGAEGPSWDPLRDPSPAVK